MPRKKVIVRRDGREDGKNEESKTERYRYKIKGKRGYIGKKKLEQKRRN